jgi:hypothetical protein
MNLPYKQERSVVIHQVYARPPPEYPDPVYGNGAATADERGLWRLASLRIGSLGRDSIPSTLFPDVT